MHSITWRIWGKRRRNWRFGKLGLAAGCLAVVVVLCGGCSAPQFDSGGPGPLTIADVSGPEGGQTLRFTVSRTTAGGAVERVAYTTEAGSATPGLDFQPAQGTLSYANGPFGERVIEVTVVDDAVDEPDETFTLRLSDPQGSVLATATATIIDDDQRGVRVWPTGLTLDEQRSASYSVVLASEPTAAVTVRAQVLDTAYAVSPERLTFTASDWARARRMTVHRIAECVGRRQGNHPPFGERRGL